MDRGRRVSVTPRATEVHDPKALGLGSPVEIRSDAGAWVAISPLGGVLFPVAADGCIIEPMDRPTLQVNVLGLLGLVGCVAVNLWLFRVGAFWGLVGLNVTKHVAIASLCRILGVDRRGEGLRGAHGPTSGSLD